MQIYIYINIRVFLNIAMTDMTSTVTAENEYTTENLSNV